MNDKVILQLCVSTMGLGEIGDEETLPLLGSVRGEETLPLLGSVKGEEHLLRQVCCFYIIKRKICLDTYN